MTDYVTLMGAEQVSNAGQAMRQAASEMQRVASSIEDSLFRHRQFLEQWLVEFRDVMHKEGGEMTQQMPVCKGTNCGATDGIHHSPECIAEHEATVNPGGKYDTLESLRAELAAAKKQCTALMVRADNFSLDCAIKDNLLAAERKDAERYRWLRDTGDSTWTSLRERFVRGGLPSVNVDAAIDAAKKEGGEG